MKIDAKDLTISQLVNVSGVTAEEHGWHDIERSPLEVAALIHSEVSEYVEDERRPLDNENGWPKSGMAYLKSGEPIGPLVELADVIIRIADWCWEKEWNLNDALIAKLNYNRTREYRHGGKLH